MPESLDRQPVVIASGQVTERSEIVTPVELMERASRLAIDDVSDLAKRIQRVSVVNVLSGAGSAPASDLSRALGLSPERTETTVIGGNSPQWLVSRAADAIWAGELDAALITGGEAQRSAWARDSTGPRRRFRDQASEQNAAGEPDPIIGEDRAGFSDAEVGAGLLAPVHVYPLFDSAIAYRNGLTFTEQRRVLGELLSPMTRVAEKHPCAWFRTSRGPGEISEPSSDNRVVSEPYTKRMCAFLGVDQAASLIVCSYKAAKEAGVADRAVFCWSGADANEVWFPTARPDLGTLAGLSAAASAAFSATKTSADEMSVFDFYSCFPSVVEMACDALGMSHRDPRGVTLTGGLPYFGGPGNAYTMFGIATLSDWLRTEGTGLGLANGIGWYATKHSVGIYGTEPPKSGWVHPDTSAQQERIDASTLPIATQLDDDPIEAHVVAGTIAHGSDGEINAAPIVATLTDGRRVAARADESVSLGELAGRNLAGESVKVLGSPPRYVLD